MEKSKLFLLCLIFPLFNYPAFSEIKVYFSPNGGCTNAIIQEIKKAQRTIDILMYSLSSRPIANTLVDAKNRGVKIRILADKGQRNEKQSHLRDEKGG